MKLKYSYNTKEEIPEAYQDLFEEQDGKFILTGIEGVKSQTDLDKLKGALQNERDTHKQTKTELQNQLKDLQKQIEDLKKGTKDPDPKPKDTDDPNVLALRKELEKQQQALEELQKEREALAAEKKQHSILEALRKSANGKVRQEAMSDLELYISQFDMTEDGKVVTKDGTQLNDWLESTLKNKPHWLPENKPSGATGGQGGTGDLTLDAKKAKLGEYSKKEDLNPRELAEAHKLALEVKAEESKAS